ncbi:MAG: hypothetical protein AB7T06_39025 [Kofleriaceae bacterium]
MKRLVLAMAIGASACSAAQKDTETLSESIRVFNEGVRWQRYSVAATAIPPKDRAKFVDEMDERANELKITDYEVVKVDGAGSKAAKVQVKISWYLDREGTLRETHALQSWERHGKQWWMVDAVRVRGDEMPGLTDRVELPEATDDDAMADDKPPTSL